MRIFGLKPDGVFNEFIQKPFQKAYREETLENWLEKNPESVLEDRELLIIGRQVDTDLGKSIDLLGLDRAGNVVVVELKRNQTPRETVAQALEYAAYVERIGADQLESILHAHEDNESLRLAEYHREHFDLDESDAVSFNKDQSIVIVGQYITPEIRQTAQFLNSKGVCVTCVEFSFFQAVGGDSLMSQETVIRGESWRNAQDHSGSSPFVDQDTFLSSLDNNGRKVFARVIEWSKEESKRINWGRKGFASHVVVGDASVAVCRAFPPASGPKQVLVVTFREIERKGAVPEDVYRNLREKAGSTSLLLPNGPIDFKCPIDRSLSDDEITTLLALLKNIADSVQKHGLKR